MRKFLSNKLVILGIFTLIILSFKIDISTNDDLFTEESYFHLRQAAEIKNNFSPVLHDDLSYQGRSYRITPLFYYLIAFLPLLWIKVLSNILIAASSFLVYFISLALIRNKNIALFSAIISLFIPASIMISNSSLSPISLLLPLFLFFVLSYIKRDSWSSWPLIISLVLLLLTSPLSIFFVLSLGAYLGIQRVKNLKPKNKDIEILMFFLFLAIWYYAVTFKDALSGVSFLWANTPSQLIYPYINPAEIFSNIGLLPLLLALIGANKVFDGRSRIQLFILSIALTVSVFLLIGIFPLISGLVFLGYLCSILASIGIKSLKEFSQRSKYSLNKIIFPFLLIVFASTTLFPFIEQNINQNVPSEEKIDSLLFLSEVDGTIISSPREAHLIMYFANKETYYDDYFIFSNAQERYDNSLKIYAGNSVFEASEILNKENIDWIYLSEETKEFYGIKELRIADLDNCIREVYDKEVFIYENRCQIT